VDEVAVDAAGEFFAEVMGGDGFQPVDERGDREFGRVADEQADVVVFAVELAEFGAEPRAYIAHDLLAPGEHLPVEDVTRVSRDEDKMDVEVMDNAAAPADIRMRFPAWRHRYELNSD
jgi:hypothetical protein